MAPLPLIWTDTSSLFAFFYGRYKWNISGGEAKRLSLLRLINRPSDFNLFDEPTASLDKEMGSKVWEVIFSSFNRRGLICATHDLAALPSFDRVIVIRQGKVIADGHWCELETVSPVAETVKEIAESG